MKKLTFVLAIMFSTIFAQAQIPCEVSQNATITIPVLYYADENISFTTATTADLTCYLVSAASSTIVETNNTGFEATGEAYNIMLPSNLLSTVGIYQFNYGHAECIKGFVYLDVLPSLVYDDQYGITDRIATIDGIADSILTDTSATIPGTITTIDDEIEVIDTNVDAILVDTGTTIPGTITTIDNEIATIDANVDAILVDTGTDIPGTIVDVSAAIAAGVSPTDIIPASGITRPSPNYGKIIGDFEPNLWFEGLSSTDATPTISIELLAASGSGLVLWATEAAFTYSKYTTHTGEYKHRYKYQITNSLPDDWYIGHFNCQSEGSWYSVPFNFIKDASIVIDAGSLLTAATFNSFVSDASQSFNDIKSGHPNRFQIYTSDHHLVRAQAGVSSAKSRYVTAGLIYGSSVSYIDRFSDLIRSATWLYDYDEATNTRGGVYELLNSDLTAESVIDNVSISVPGD